METHAFADAPPPTRLGGCLVVPLHIVDLQISVEVDAAASRMHVDSTMAYKVGPTAGNPFFDLRQRVEDCWIDGVRVPPSAIAHRSIGQSGQKSAVRIIDEWQRAGSAHRMRATYRMGLPMSDLGGAYPPRLSWSAGPRVRWSLGMADLYAGRYLEAWFPSNLPFDHFPITLDLRITGTRVVHTVITNGRVATTGTNRWTLRFPPYSTTMSPLIELHAADTVQAASAAVFLPKSRRPIIVSACKPNHGSENLATNIDRIAVLLSEQEWRFGDFIGDSYTCFFHGTSGGMEYAHATTTAESALRHEVIHSWFARGVTPASQADGWWDEGFTRYLEVHDQPEPFDFGLPPVELCSRRPFQRTTSPLAYEAGSRLFRGIAALIGSDQLIAVMKEFFGTYRGRSASTATLEGFLIAATGAVSLVDAFHRFVYGFGDQSPEPRLRAEIVGGERPEPTRDGAIAVRISNMGTVECRHFVVIVTEEKPLPTRRPVAVVTQFDLAPGMSRTVRIPLPYRAPALSRRLEASVHAGGDRRPREPGAHSAVQLRRRA